MVQTAVAPYDLIEDHTDESHSCEFKLLQIFQRTGIYCCIPYAINALVVPVVPERAVWGILGKKAR